LVLELRYYGRHRRVYKHGFSDENKVLVKHLYQLKGYKATGLLNEFQTNGEQKVALTG